MKLYNFHISGNSYKIRLLLAQLRVPYEKISVDLLHGENRRPEFLAKNPIGRVPVLEVEPGHFLGESPAILFYLSEGTPFQPDTKWERARMWQWMAFEQYEHEPSIAKSRAWISVFKNTAEREEQLAQMAKQGYRALTVMEAHLRDHEYFTGVRYGIADIALYAYTHVAHEGNFDLTGFPSVKTWLERVRQQPKHISISE